MPNPARWRALLAVSDRLPSERPWKAPRKAMALGRPVWWRASLRAASTASVPELRQERPWRRRIGARRGEPLADVGVGGQVEVARAVVQDVVDLGVDRRVDVRVGVTGGDDGDAGVEVEEAVAVDVLDDAAPAALHDERVDPGERRAGHRLVAGDDRARRSGRAARSAASGAVESAVRSSAMPVASCRAPIRSCSSSACLRSEIVRQL